MISSMTAFWKDGRYKMLLMSELTFSMSGNWPCLTVIATHSLPFVDIDKTLRLLDTLTEKDAVYKSRWLLNILTENVAKIMKKYEIE